MHIYIDLDLDIDIYIDIDVYSLVAYHALPRLARRKHDLLLRLSYRDVSQVSPLFIYIYR